MGKRKHSSKGRVVDPVGQSPIRPGGSFSWSFPTALLVAAGIALSYFFEIFQINSISSADVSRASELKLMGLKKVEENNHLGGLALIDEALTLNPQDPSGYSDKAGVLRTLGRNEEALRLLEEGERVVDQHHEKMWLLYQGLFFLNKDLGKNRAALRYIEKEAEIHPSARVYYNWASLDNSVVDDYEKIQLLDKSLEFENNYMAAFCERYHTYAHVGDWDSIDRDHSRMIDYMTEAIKHTGLANQSCLRPYAITYLNFSSEMMRETAKLYAIRDAGVPDEHVLPTLRPSDLKPQFGDDGKRIRKLRIGYVSSDFSQHPVGRNVLGLFIGHDKKKYDIFCFSTKHKPEDPITKMIQQVVTYVDCEGQSYHATAKMIREEYQIDVLVDLNGWTTGERLEIFAAQPAPVQLTHGLGYVGTSGVDAFQYFVSDAVASPQRFADQYTEKILRLPVSYLPASHRYVHTTSRGSEFDPTNIEKAKLRKEHGLPEKNSTFIFCSFQSMHKISRESFDTWMRILKRSPDSILWLGLSSKQRETILNYAENIHGVEMNRFAFAEKLSPGSHLERAQVCDLHLDSWPYNSHSTAADIIWAGVPLLSYLPDYHDPRSKIQVPKMCSRVSASLLHTLGMPQLIMSTVQDYENEAVRIAKDKDSYNAIRNELMEKRISSDLYNIKKYAVSHEVLYAQTFENFMQGMDPVSITL